MFTESNRFSVMQEIEEMSVLTDQKPNITRMVMGSSRMLSGRVMEVSIHPLTGDFHFLPGQFVGLRPSNSGSDWQYYSISSDPAVGPVHGKGFNLCINIDSEIGNSLFKQKLIEGVEVEVYGPFGSLTLEDKLYNRLVFIATGTGIAPFRSIILDLYRKGEAPEEVHLIYGARNEDEILYKSDFESIVKENEGFTYDVVLSRQANWEGYKGRVRDVYMDKYPEAIPGVLFYLCGWPEMVRQTIQDLIKERHFSQDQLIYEIYE